MTPTPLARAAPLAQIAPQVIPTISQTPSFSVAASEEKMVLKYALNNMATEDLHKQFLNSVDKLLPEQVEELNRVMEMTGIVLASSRKIVKDDTVRHCLRCHYTYFERNNGRRACNIPHQHPIQDPHSAEVGRILYPCCGYRSHVGYKVVHECFTGRHTTLGGNVNYGTRSVRTCEQARCFQNMRQA
ncbi:hypothetical protein BDZ94DRAFT_1347261 [Collybia nuda]|uniref:Uncharacterized protein n=1 Tax=Collybia nuda TaxID=64659 RepID=A0A9P5YD56_9AGAR|nr:hypothetical protein BDZ94DRAFT_1347261 [Collybia nuda]